MIAINLFFYHISNWVHMICKAHLQVQHSGTLAMAWIAGSSFPQTVTAATTHSYCSLQVKDWAKRYAASSDTAIGRMAAVSLYSYSAEEHLAQSMKLRNFAFRDKGTSLVACILPLQSRLQKWQRWKPESWQSCLVTWVSLLQIVEYYVSEQAPNQDTVMCYTQ